MLTVVLLAVAELVAAVEAPELPKAKVNPVGSLTDDLPVPKGPNNPADAVNAALDKARSISMESDTTAAAKATAAKKASAASSSSEASLSLQASSIAVHTGLRCPPGIFSLPHSAEIIATAPCR